MIVIQLFYVLLLLLVPKTLGISEEMQELAKQLHATCVSETGAKEDDISNAVKGIFSEDEGFKCYLKCLMSQMAIIDDDGTIDVEAMVAILPDELVEHATPIVRKCGSIKGSNACDSAWLTHQCYYREGPEHYFLF
ncbi:hypothetical protein ABEB36_006348 [Hypothenemus hampei]|uniref:Uncharacterized protein n=1 Tax=Hypothenemus hampei TaxID=57062 RepID=A0ABD1EQN8_HYPHA